MYKQTTVVAGRFVTVDGQAKFGVVEFLPWRLWFHDPDDGEDYMPLAPIEPLENGKFLVELTTYCNYKVFTPLGEYYCTVPPSLDGGPVWLKNILVKT